MTADQFDEWIAYYRLEPWGIEMLDWLIAHFKALFANANRDVKKKKKGYKPAEFLCFGGRKFEVKDINDGREPLEETFDEMESNEKEKRGNEEPKNKLD